MRFYRENEDQKEDRIARHGERSFAWLPKELSDGTIVWLEHFWRATEVYGEHVALTSQPCRYKTALHREDALSDWAKLNGGAC